MLPLSLDVRLKGDKFPKAVLGIIAGTAIIHSFSLIIQFFWPHLDRSDWLAFHYDTPDPLQYLIAIFSHANWAHWFWNMFYLWVFGAALEDRLGWRKFLILFVICGAAGHLITVVLYYPIFWNERAWPIYSTWGASGAIFGVMGLCQARFVKVRMRVGWGPLLADWIPLFNWKIPVTWLCAYRLGYEILALGADDHINHFAHIGGFLGGLACADFLGIKRDSKDELIQNQAEELAGIGWWIQAMERYDRLLALHPRSARYREARLRCMFKLWPRNGAVGDRQRAETFQQLERTLALYFSGGEPAEALRLFGDFAAYFSPAELSPKQRLQYEAARAAANPGVWGRGVLKLRLSRA